MGLFGNRDNAPENGVEIIPTPEAPESDATSIADDAEKLRLEKEQFEADKVAFNSEKEVYATQKEADEAAALEKQAQIDEYQERVKSNNREVEHIDFDKTNIKFIGKRRVGKPTAKAPTGKPDVEG